MNAVKDHVFALQLTIEQLSKGRTWLYLLPAIAVALVFFSIFHFFNSLSRGAETFQSLPLVGTYVTSGVQSSLSFISWTLDLLFKFFILGLLSPVNCLLSERTDNEVTGAKFNGGFLRVMTDLLRALVLVIFSLMLNLVTIAIWALISWITGFHALDGIIYFLIGAFFLGFSFYDYSLERYNINILLTIGFGFEKMSYMLITGTVFSLIYLVPHVGLILAPFLVTIMSTIVYLKMNNRIPNNQIKNSIQQ